MQGLSWHHPGKGLNFFPRTSQSKHTPGAYTSTQTGNWSSPSTWGYKGPPTVGDSATIATGTTVTADASPSVGTSPNNQTTFDLTINGPTGKLIIGTGSG